MRVSRILYQCKGMIQILPHYSNVPGRPSISAPAWNGLTINTTVAGSPFGKMCCKRLCNKIRLIRSGAMRGLTPAVKYNLRLSNSRLTCACSDRRVARITPCQFVLCSTQPLCTWAHRSVLRLEHLINVTLYKLGIDGVAITSASGTQCIGLLRQG